MRAIDSQFEHPRGLLGRLIGYILAVENRERIDWAINLLKVEPTDHILEIGFGPGISIQRLARLTPSGFVAGVDHSAEMVRQASKRNARDIRGGRVELKQSSVDHLPYPNSQFDKALTINSLHIWADTQASLREVRRVLEPGGRLAVVEQPPSKVAEDTVIRQRGDELQTILSRAGFREFEVHFGSFRRGLAVFISGRK